MSRRTSAAVAVAAALASLAGGSAATAATPTDTSALRDAVTVDAVRAHQAALQKIADQNDGHREASSSGYTESADYVAEQLSAAGYQVTRQPFGYNYFEELAPPTLTGSVPFTYTAAGDDANIATMGYSGNGSVTGVVQYVTPTVPLPVGAPDSSTSDGCEASDFANFTGDIALIQRGTCDFAVKIANAEAAGAEAVIIFNEGNSAERSDVGFGQATFPQAVPVLEMSAASGAELVEYIRSHAGDETLTLTTSTISEPRTSENVIADGTTGRTDRVVVSGAHLDSVAEGPGINDNGSGTGAQLETAIQMAELGISPRNQTRFMFFGAEEAGLVGSTYYVSTLATRQLKNIAVMLNFDMVGSPNAGWFVYDGDASDTASTGSTGSGVVEDVFVDFFDSISRQTEPTAFDGRSDYDAFVAAGIPAGGLFTGAEDPKSVAQALKWGGTAGLAFDPCYHAACDTFGNVNLTALDEMSDAVAHGVLTFAQTTSSVQGTDKGSDSSTTYDPDYKGSKAIR
jgi:Zn-dependent M28 family amino/carboxypeptidase